jgi:hypothetical protein
MLIRQALRQRLLAKKINGYPCISIIRHPGADVPQAQELPNA